MITDNRQTLWDQMSPEQRTRILAILVQMLLRKWIQEIEAQHESA